MFVKASSLSVDNVIIHQKMRLKVISVSPDFHEQEIHVTFADRRTGKKVKLTFWENDLVNRIDGISGIMR